LCREGYWEAIDKNLEKIDLDLLKLELRLAPGEDREKAVQAAIQDIVEDFGARDRYVTELLTKNKLLYKVLKFEVPDSCPLCEKKIGDKSVLRTTLLGNQTPVITIHNDCLRRLETKRRIDLDSSKSISSEK